MTNNTSCKQAPNWGLIPKMTHKFTWRKKSTELWMAHVSIRVVLELPMYAKKMWSQKAAQIPNNLEIQMLGMQKYNLITQLGITHFEFRTHLHTPNVNWKVSRNFNVITCHKDYKKGRSGTSLCAACTWQKTKKCGQCQQHRENVHSRGCRGVL